MLTVLMATFNGAGTLPRVLDAYTRLQTPAGGWQLVVADNASTDDTPAVLASHVARLPMVVQRNEDRGKNIALNLALPLCEGDLVVLTDDDAVPQSDWLCELGAAAAAQPEFDTFGGLIVPLWPNDQCPEWIPRLVNLGATFAVTPEGMTAGPVMAGRVWGPNMAIRRAVFDAGHRFDESVGPSAGQYMMGSEVEFTCRIERAGHRAWYVPTAQVGHIIRPRQLDPQWIIDRGYRLGRHMFHQERGEIGAQVARFRGAPRWMWRRYLQHRLRSTWARLRGSFDDRFTADWEISFLRGYFAEAASARRA